MKEFTAVYVEGRRGWVIALAEKFPSIVTQGRTIEQARHRISEAVSLLLAAHRDMTAENIASRRVLARETLQVAAVTSWGSN